MEQKENSSIILKSIEEMVMSEQVDVKGGKNAKKPQNPDLSTDSCKCLIIAFT